MGQPVCSGCGFPLGKFIRSDPIIETTSFFVVTLYSTIASFLSIIQTITTTTTTDIYKPRQSHTSLIMASSPRTSTIAAITAGTVVTGLVAYAIYFDHRRRTDPNFRKELKRESKRQARAAKEEAEAGAKEQRQAIRDAVARANEEGFPKDPEEVEAYFMQEVAQGEALCQQGTETQFNA